MSKLIQDLYASRELTEKLSTELNQKVEHVLLLLLKLTNPQMWEESDLWWWYGSDDDRPFRRGDRHGYAYDVNENLEIFLDEPYCSIPGFDKYYYEGDRCFSNEKAIPLKYLEMSDEDIVLDATAVITKQTQERTLAKQQNQSNEQAAIEAREAALAKLSDEDKKALGLS